MPTVVTMADGEVITLEFSNVTEELENEALGVIEKYCGSDFLRYYKGIAIEAAEEREAENYDAEAGGGRIQGRTKRNCIHLGRIQKESV